VTTLVKVNDKGIFTLASPFLTLTGVEYTVTNISTIDTMLARGDDVLQDVFLGNGLTADDYTNAIANKTLIVTLTSAINTTITLPASYITGTPNVNTVPYARRILSVDLGSLPTNYPLDGLKVILKDTVLAAAGVTATLNEYTASTTGAVSMDQHVALEDERSRLKTTGETERQRRIKAEQNAAAYKERMLALEKIVVEQQKRLDEQDA